MTEPSCPCTSVVSDGGFDAGEELFDRAVQPFAAVVVRNGIEGTHGRGCVLPCGSACAAAGPTRAQGRQGAGEFSAFDRGAEPNSQPVARRQRSKNRQRV